MIIKKVKFNIASSSCNVTYIDKDENNVDVRSKNQCTKDLVWALDDLRKWVANICELESGSIDELKEKVSSYVVDGVSVDYDESMQLTKIQLSSKKRLQNGLVFSFNTPPVDEDYSFFEMMTEDVENLIEEARLYIEERKFIGAQQVLDFVK